MSILEQLRTALSNEENCSEVERLLYRAWSTGEIRVSGDDHNLEPYKLLNRTENHKYDSPTFTFQIERHGATVNGSVYAEVHTWQVDTETGEATITAARERQIYPRAPRLDTAILAKEIAAVITNELDDPRVQRKNGRLKINIGATIPETNAMTTSGRRKRFRAALQSKLPEWEISRTWILTRSTPKGEDDA